MFPERVPEYRMPYEDRMREEAWAIARSREECRKHGIEWKSWMLNVVAVNVAELLSGRRPELKITIPTEEDYFWAKQRIDAYIEDRNYRFTRQQRAKLIYCPLPDEDEFVHPELLTLCASWNGMRDPLSVAEFFFLAGIPDEELKSVFHYDPENVPTPVRSRGDGFFGFANSGRQRLVDLVRKPFAFIHFHTEGRRLFSWDLKSKEVFYPTR